MPHEPPVNHSEPSNCEIIIEVDAGSPDTGVPKISPKEKFQAKWKAMGNHKFLVHIYIAVINVLIIIIANAAKNALLSFARCTNPKITDEMTNAKILPNFYSINLNKTPLNKTSSNTAVAIPKPILIVISRKKTFVK